MHAIEYNISIEKNQLHSTNIRIVGAADRIFHKINPFSFIKYNRRNMKPNAKTKMGRVGLELNFI